MNRGQTPISGNQGQTTFFLRLALLLLVPAAVGAQRPANLDEVVVAADSPIVRAVRAQPVPPDYFGLLVARETFRLAGDRRAAQSVDDYLARAGLLALAGQPVKPAGTIGRLADDPAAMPQPPAGLAEKTLRSALYPHPVGPADLGEAGGQYRVLVDIENIGERPIAQFDTGLRIDLAGDERVLLACRPSAPFERLAPREMKRHACSIAADRLPFDALARAVDAAHKLPERWRLMPTRIAYADPAVSFGSRGIYYWLDTPRAARQAVAQLKAAGCSARASCIADLRREVESRPGLLYAVGGLLLAASAGWLYLRLRRR